MYYVYVLQLTNGKLYTGYTKDLKRRYKAHQANQVISTKRREPKLVQYEAYLSKEDAIKRENMLKQNGQAKRHLKDRIRNRLDLII